MKAVHFGAGNIGRGFLGQLYYESGYSVTFVDVMPELVTLLQTRGGYPIRIVGDNPQTIQVKNVTAVSGLDLEKASDALAEADLASTAVGTNVLPRIAPALALAITKRFTTNPEAAPLNIIICENLIDAGPFLRNAVRTHLAPEFHALLEDKVGFVEASIGRMVPLMTDEMRREDPLLVCVEAYCELPVDAHGFRGAMPPLKHMKPAPNFKAYVERKLFVHNAGHATTAYLGYLKGYDYIWQAIEDPKIRQEADAAMAESCAGLARKHGLALSELNDHWADLAHRFANKELGDQVVRVAADPVRKLGPRDRLIGAALMCLSQGIEPAHLAFAAAAAIRYDYRQDIAAQKVQDILGQTGIVGVLTHFCQLEADAPLVALILKNSERLQHEGWIK